MNRPAVSVAPLALSRTPRSLLSRVRNGPDSRGFGATPLAADLLALSRTPRSLLSRVRNGPDSRGFGATPLAADLLALSRTPLSLLSRVRNGPDSRGFGATPLAADPFPPPNAAARLRRSRQACANRAVPPQATRASREPAAAHHL